MDTKLGNVRVDRGIRGHYVGDRVYSDIHLDESNYGTIIVAGERDSSVSKQFPGGGAGVPDMVHLSVSSSNAGLL